jgi:hypothetical protein
MQALASRARDERLTVDAWLRREVLLRLSDQNVSAWPVSRRVANRWAGIRESHTLPRYQLRWLRDASIEQRVFLLLNNRGILISPDALAIDTTFTSKDVCLALRGSGVLWDFHTVGVGPAVEITLFPFVDARNPGPA